MVSGRHRCGRSGAARRVSPQVHQERFQPPTLSYNHSHINLLQTSVDEDLAEPDSHSEDDFILKKSIQVEIEEQLRYKEKLASILESPTRPRTFAEAAMSTKARGRTGRKNSGKEDNSEVTLSRLMSLESLGPFKYTFKKRKKGSKWSPLDLSVADSASEVGSLSDVERAPSRGVSPKLHTSFGFPSYPPSLQSDEILDISISTPGKDSGKDRMIESEVTEIDAEPTPTQDRFDSAVLVLADLSGTANSSSSLHPADSNWSLDQIDPDLSDTQSTKDRTDAAMASITRAFGASNVSNVGGDAFDSLEWDPDLPSSSAPDESPEPVTVTPQPVAYTTVGSLVNPNVVPQFTAPNRIQREGAGRRPLMPLLQSRSLMQNRHQESSYFPLRDSPPPLNMQHSMHYTQQLTQSPVRFSQSTQQTPARSSPSALSSHQLLLSEQEKQILKMTTAPALTPAPQMYSGNIIVSPSNPNPSNKLFSNPTDSKLPNLFPSGLDTNRQVFSVMELMEEEEQGRSSGPQGSVHGLEKMQTLQRLSKFDNPMQELARSRLSEFSIAKSMGKTVANPTGSSVSLETLLRKSSTSAPKPGELNFGYQFPPSSSLSQANPLFGAYGASISQTPVTSSRQSGVPQPLTAGPPGQRQSHVGGSSKPSASYFDNFYTNSSDSQGQFYNPHVNHQIYQSHSPWSKDYGNAIVSKPIAPVNHQVDVDHSKPLDTLPIPVVSKYYPVGLPNDMSGKFNPLPYDTMNLMGQIPSEPLKDDEKKAKKAKDLNDWFYGGQRRLAMSAEDHIHDLEQRQAVNSFGPIGPPSSNKTFAAVENKPITNDQMKNMSTAAAAAPLLDAAFGSLLAYAEKSTESRSVLSKFETSPAWQIDSSDKGNISFFGEDWGPPPKRFGRDPRYQSVFHNPSTTHWEY